jgi:PhzF family phenazine biosynthesis protein
VKRNAVKIPIHQIDAFADRLFLGNPAAVCHLERWLPDDLMQKIAMENNLAETAFFLRQGGDRFAIRWFTPAVEVDLCGHATLATAFVIFELEGFFSSLIEFDSRSGILRVKHDGDLLTLDFPADIARKTAVPKGLSDALGASPVEAYEGKTDIMLVFKTRKEIEAMTPDFGRLAELPVRGVIVTAEGGDVDFVSRFFAPRVGIPEDPVTGSAHTLLAPYWAAKLGKSELTALQISRRGGSLFCRIADDRVEISGRARRFMSGTIEISD